MFGKKGVLKNNRSGAEAWIFGNNKINTMALDSLRH